MRKVKRTASSALLIGTITLLAGCGAPAIVSNGPESTGVTKAPAQTAPAQKQPAQTKPAAPGPSDPKAPAGNTTGTGTKPSTQKDSSIVTDKPADIAVLVNKKIMLPDGYKPADLMEPNVPFIFTEKDEKRLMRQEAAHALEKMFAAAKQDGIFLAGVSGYRSYETQRSLFDYYVRTQGEEVARQYSAEPGHSEHQTGLAMDVSGSTGKCAADDCFANEPEAPWLAKHAAEYGFIIRYPKGKEAITGYAYEPWHVRYVGLPIAKEIAAKGITLEEYYGAH